MSIFTPTIILKRIQQIDQSLLERYGIKAMILDVDNTLTPHGSQLVDATVMQWLKTMIHCGIQLMIASNNNRKRIHPFAEKIGLEYISMSCKPLTYAFTKAHKKFGLKSSEIAVVGDQIYTDIVGGNLKGMVTILVEPFQLETTLFFRLKRKFEKMHIDKYYELTNARIDKE